MLNGVHFSAKYRVCELMDKMQYKLTVKLHVCIHNLRVLREQF